MKEWLTAHRNLSDFDESCACSPDRKLAIAFVRARKIVSAVIANQREASLAAALSLALGIGAVTLIALAATSLIEWVIVNVPAKRMGVFGVALLLIGFGSNPSTIGLRYST